MAETAALRSRVPSFQASTSRADGFPGSAPAVALPSRRRRHRHEADERLSGDLHGTVEVAGCPSGLIA